jgi:hypothetical protein
VLVTTHQVTEQAAMAHKLLPQQHPAVHLVKRVGTRIAQVGSSNPLGAPTRYDTSPACLF